ncbi:MAG: YigZ family protein, partial [Clostridia bacterium]|nr:YigZ family protein [Clostridia bacterium]
TRAYSTVAKEALAKCEKQKYIEYTNKTLECEYKEEEQTIRTLKQQGCIIENIIRTDKVTLKYLEPKGM